MPSFCLTGAKAVSAAQALSVTSVAMLTWQWLPTGSFLTPVEGHQESDPHVPGNAGTSVSAGCQSAGAAGQSAVGASPAANADGLASWRKTALPKRRQKPGVAKRRCPLE